MFSIFLTMFWEMTKTILGKVAWKVVFERFYTRLVIWGLVKIRDLSTNDVLDDTLTDIIRSLKGKRLKVADEVAEKVEKEGKITL